MSERGYHMLGWILFVVSAIGFLVASVRAEDVAAVIGSLFFLIACIVFLIPYFKHPPDH